MLASDPDRIDFEACDYCRAECPPAALVRLQIDPGKGDGAENFASACSRCAEAKGETTHAADPLDGRLVPLFHPRSQRWSDHIVHGRYGLRARSAIGRATAAALFRSPPPLDAVGDLRWDALETLSREHPAYRHLNYLRYLRLGNHFDRMHEHQKLLPGGVDDSPAERSVIEAARLQLELETRFTRSTPADVVAGIRSLRRLLAEPSGPPAIRRTLHQIAGTLYQQLATLAFLRGRRRVARRWQKQAAHHALDVRLLSRRPQRSPITTPFGSRLRARSLTAKYEPQSLSAVELVDWRRRVLDADRLQATNDARALLDLALRTNLSAGHTDDLYEVSTSLLAASDYGSDRNIALAVGLRRRWWILHLRAERTPSYDLLAGDLELWRRLQMWNEMRELLSLVARSRHLLSDPVADEATGILSKVLGE